MSITRFILYLTVSFLVAGCAKSKLKPDPLEGFHVAALYTPDSHKTITDDYKGYIQTLSPDERKNAGPIEFYEDGTGQHAVLIMIGINGTVWRHILIYDKDSKRIKTIKYASGDYHS